MAVSNRNPPFLAKTLAALAIIVVGFLVLAYGYRAGSIMTLIGGAVLVAAGLVIIALKIARRNREGAV